MRRWKLRSEYMSLRPGFWATEKDMTGNVTREVWVDADENGVFSVPSGTSAWVSVVAQPVLI